MLVRHAAAGFWAASWLGCSPWQDAAPHPHRAAWAPQKVLSTTAECSAAVLLGVYNATTLKRV